MKKLLLLLNLILVPVSYFGYRYYKDTPPRKDYSSYAISSDEGKSTILQVASEGDVISSKDVDEVIDAVPFDPKRCGETKKEDQNQAPAVRTNSSNPNLKLVGICQMGKRSGAIIIDNSGHHARPQPRVMRTSYRSHSARRPTPPPVRKPDTQTFSQSCYYRVGDKLPCGYDLKEIREESVMLAQGSNSFELKLETAATAPTAATALPEKRIIGAAGGAAKNRTAVPNRTGSNRNVNDRGLRK